MKNGKNFFGTCAAAVVAGVIGLSIGANSFADDQHGGGGHKYDSAMKHHVEMAKGAEGAAQMKKMMLMMSAHQSLLGQMAESDDVKKLAATPEMKKAIDDVKAAMKDHDMFDKKKDEVASNEREAMMVLAHALLKQDAEAERMLKAAEEGKQD